VRDSHLGETEPASSSYNDGPRYVHLYHSDHNEGHLNYESQSQRPLKKALWEKKQELRRIQTEQPELRSTEADLRNEDESPHYEQQQEPPLRTHMAHEQVSEHEKAQP
jgi:hypothetical protein